MRIEIKMLNGQQLQASFSDHHIISDQSVEVGGTEKHPEPFEYFLASMPLCAAFYIRKFCQSRDISTDGINISQDNENIDADNKYKKKIVLSIELPENFPKKYHKAVLLAANTCTVKRVVQAMPEFEAKIV